MYWTLVGDLQEPCSLFSCERPRQDNLTLDLVEQPDLGFAVRAVISIDPGVFQTDLDVPQWPLFAPGIHGDRHRRARAEGGE